MDHDEIGIRWLKTPRAKTAHARLWGKGRPDPPRSLCNQVAFEHGTWHQLRDDATMNPCPICTRRLEWVAELLNWWRAR